VEIFVQPVIIVPAQTPNIQIIIEELLCLIRVHPVLIIQIQALKVLRVVLIVLLAFTASTMAPLLPCYAKKDGIAMPKKSHRCLPTNFVLKATTARRAKRQRVQAENTKIRSVEIVVILALMVTSAPFQILQTA